MKDKNLITVPAGFALVSDMQFMDEHPEFTKVSFPVLDGDVVNERMWVRITEGDRYNGSGIIDNEPAYAEYVKYEDTVEYATEGDSVTPVFKRKIASCEGGAL